MAKVISKIKIRDVMLAATDFMYKKKICFVLAFLYVYILLCTPSVSSKHFSIINSIVILFDHKKYLPQVMDFE